ncbi:MAG: peptidase [Elusimicrobiota bacterium]|jgi:hypothetical protein
MFHAARLVSTAFVCLLSAAIVRAADPDKAPDAGRVMRDKVAQFAPVSVGVDLAKIAPAQRFTLKKIIDAARYIDAIYLRQVAAENPQWRNQIAADPKLSDTLAYFDIMYGPWDRLDGNQPFWGAKLRPQGAAFYPEDLTAKELEAYIAQHPKEKEALSSYFTVVVRDGARLQAVPYSEAYSDRLRPAAKLLEEAAAGAPDQRLAAFLRARAKAFLSNQYRESDMAWMDLGDGDIEIVIGPYEVYNDDLMGYKAAFEAFVTLRDQEASKELAKIQSFIPALDQALPLAPEYRGPRRGLESPISVVDVLYNAGDNRAGVQTLAFNLPNDEFVREKKGSKKVMLKNIGKAKFEKILVPIARALVRPDQVGKVTFEAFFNHTLVHEVSHGIGPGSLTLNRNGKAVKTTVNQELKDLYSTIEEAKADAIGLFGTLFLIDQKLHPETFREEVYATFLGGFFRSVRFGANEAHGQANAIQFNYLKEKGAIEKGADGRYAYAADKMPGAVKDLVHDLLLIEARGSYSGAREFIAKYGKLPPDLVEQLAGLQGIPTDLRLSFPILEDSRKW